MQPPSCCPIQDILSALYLTCRQQSLWKGGITKPRYAWILLPPFNVFRSPNICLTSLSSVCCPDFVHSHKEPYLSPRCCNRNKTPALPFANILRQTRESLLSLILSAACRALRPPAISLAFMPLTNDTPSATR